MGVILSIDYGLKRIGLAVSDPNRIFAFAYGIIENKNFSFVLVELKKIIEDKSIKMIIIGIPYNMDKTKSEMTRQVESFVKKLKESINIKISLVDETLSTFSAEQNLHEIGFSSKKSKKYLDTESARLMLEEYLANIKK